MSQRQTGFVYTVCALTAAGIWLVWLTLDRQREALGTTLNRPGVVNQDMNPVYENSWTSGGMTVTVRTYPGEAETPDALYELHKQRVDLAKAGYPPD